MRVGGLYRAPRAELAALVEKLEWAREVALETVRVTAGFDFPDFEYDYEFVALLARRVPDRSRAHRLEPRPRHRVSEYDEHFVEEHVALPTRCTRRSRTGPYLVGPLARYALNPDRLSPLAREAAHEAGLDPIVRNPFRSIIVRSVELVHACDEALRLIDEYEEPAAPALEVVPRARRRLGGTEAPRGMLYHRYAIDDDGDDPRREDRSADLAEPEVDRGGPVCVVSDRARPPRRRAATPLRAGDPQLRPVHLVRDALPQARGRAP